MLYYGFMNERDSNPVEPKKEPLDFSAINRDALPDLAQDLIASNDVGELERLRDYARACLNKLPPNTMYSTEWDYWNYTYLIGDITAAISPDDAAKSD